MNECPRCGTPLSPEGVTTIEPVECPTCGYAIGVPQASRTGFGLVRSYFHDLWQILTHPYAFFRQMAPNGPLSYPIAFALVTHWLGAALAFLWHSVWVKWTGIPFFQYFQNLFSPSWEQDLDIAGNPSFDQMKNRVYEWLAGAGPVIADPFFTLASILFTAFLLFIGARLFISPSEAAPNGTRPEPCLEKVTFTSAVKIVSFGMSPAILTGIPILGNFVAPLYVWIVTIIGIHAVYRVSIPRAVVISLFPKLLIPGIIAMGLALFLFSFLRMVLSF